MLLCFNSRRIQIKTNYLNNKDILKEIHKSKISYSSFLTTSDSDYDMIVSNINELEKKSIIETAKELRAERLAKLAYDQAIAAGEKKKLEEFSICPTSIKNDEVVFRIMMWDHIPLNDSKKSINSADLDEDNFEELEISPPTKISAKYVKLNFPPFQHFRLDKNNKSFCVGKSHWFGDLEEGYFSIDHGKMTNKLAHMFIKLCERYATRGNWRNYCVDHETEALTKRGWVREEEITENDTILSFNGENLAWSEIKSIYRGQYTGKMFHLTQIGLDSLITPNHKLVTDKGLVPIEYIKTTDKILMLGDAIQNHNEHFSDEFLELAAWIFTNGCYKLNDKGQIKKISISQNNNKKCDRIRNCLNKVNYKFTEITNAKSNISFSICREDSIKFFEIFPIKNITMDFIVSMSTRQREIFLNTLIDGNGRREGPNNKYLRYTHENKKHIDLFQALCVLTGRRSNAHFVENKMSFGKLTNYYSINVFSKKKNISNGSCIHFNGGQNNGRNNNIQLGNGKLLHPNFPTVDYNGIVWCPETEYGCFVARRNNTVFLTGNTYVDEMKGQALLQLSQIGLQFDESKGNNPFAYYTSCLINSFTRVLNTEKKNQNIRDDILQMNNYAPSYTRQNDWGNSNFDD